MAVTSHQYEAILTGKKDRPRVSLSLKGVGSSVYATGEEIDKAEVVKGNEYDRGHFVTFTAEELKALDLESSKIIDLEKFVPNRSIDPVYFDSSHYVYPDGPIGVEALRVIGAAMTETSVVGLGRLTLSRRERMVMVEPRGTGIALYTLRADRQRFANLRDTLHTRGKPRLLDVGRGIPARDRFAPDSPLEEGRRACRRSR